MHKSSEEFKRDLFAKLNDHKNTYEIKINPIFFSSKEETLRRLMPEYYYFLKGNK